MSLHLTVPGVQEYGAMALMSLVAAHEKNQGEVVSDGALKQILQTMRAHRDNVSVLDACVRMLLNLVLKKDTHTGAICREGGILVLLDTMKSHPGEPTLQSRCTSLMKRVDSSGVQQRQGEWIMAEMAAERQRITELMKALLEEQQRFFEDQERGGRRGATSDRVGRYRRQQAASSILGSSHGRSRSHSPPAEAIYNEGAGFGLEQLQAFNTKVSNARALRPMSTTRGSYLR